jgi:hypothetical protein
VPTWSPVSASVPAVIADLQAAVGFDVLPPELQAKILELLAAVEAGRLTLAEARAKARELTAFADLDADLQQGIDDLLASAAAAADQPDQLAADDPMSGAMSADVQWARENMASRLAMEEAQRAKAEDGKAGEAEEGSEQGPTTEQTAEGDAGEASDGQTTQRVPIKSADAAEGASGMMMKGDGKIGEPGSAFGGKRAAMRYGTGATDQLEAALKREQIEATANFDNSDLRNEERRRQTERGWSSIGYSRVAGRPTFDRSRAEARRVVPEARRPLLGRYFVRENTAAGQPPAGSSQGRRE